MLHAPFVARLAKLFGRRSLAPEPAATAPPARDATVVLVDVDNVQARLEETDRSVSWVRLKEHLRTTGTLTFCDAFVSPKSLTDTRVLWEAGFHVIACPMQAKDKDAVDAKITARALQYLFLTGVTRIVVVSDDHDFDPLAVQAADVGKVVSLVRPGAIADDIAGHDAPLPLEDSRQVRRFIQAVTRLSGNGKAKRTYTADCRFVAETAALVRTDLVAANGRAIHGIRKRLQPQLFPKWRATFRPANIKEVLTALIRADVIRVKPDGVKLNAEHPLWSHIPTP